MTQRPADRGAETSNETWNELRAFAGACVIRARQLRASPPCRTHMTLTKLIFLAGMPVIYSSLT